MPIKNPSFPFVKEVLYLYIGEKPRRLDGNKDIDQQACGGVFRFGVDIGGLSADGRPLGGTNAADVDLGLELHHGAYRYQDGWRHLPGAR